MPTRQFRRLTSVEDATRRFLDTVETVRTVESVKIQDALGRVLARRIVSRKYLPAHDIAVLDGYAVHSADVRHASARNPTILQLVGESRLGEPSRNRVGRGETVAVATGSILPKGADAVVMVENTRILGRGRIQFRVSVVPREGMTGKGEDLTPGRSVIDRGNRLRPEDIGMMKALGLATVPVVRRVQVGILSTGNELVNTARKSRPEKIVDLNRPIFAAMLEQSGAIPVDLGIVEDDEWAITSALRAGLLRTDVVLITAGSSVGKKDLVAHCINTLGSPGMLIHGISMRPAMPTGLAVVKGKPIVSLPGFPVSAMIAFRVFVRPLLARLSGAPGQVDPTVKAVLKKRVRGIEGSRTYVRVRVKRVRDGFVAVPLEAQRSSILTSMVNANGIVTVSEDIQLIEAGTEVSVTLTGDLPG